VSLCKVEVIKGHVMGFFVPEHTWTAYIPTDARMDGTYLYETACGSFAAVRVKAQNPDVDAEALTLMESDKVRIFAL